MAKVPINCVSDSDRGGSAMTKAKQQRRAGHMQIVNDKGERLYMNEEERLALLAAADKAPREIRCFTRVLLFTGCRISEALELTPKSIDLSAREIIFRSLKKRQNQDGTPKIVHRHVPIPPELLDCLEMVFGIRQLQKKARSANVRLWTWSRMTAWRHVHGLIAAAGIADGPWASPKGLRHGYGVNAACKGIPLNMLQKWLGHADMTTTSIYANASGEEEQSIASRMWA